MLAKIFSSKFYRRLLVKAIRTIHIGITTIHFITTDTIMSLGALLKIMFLTSIKRYKRLFLSRKTSQLYIPLLKKIQLWVWCTIKKYYEKESYTRSIVVFSPSSRLIKGHKDFPNTKRKLNIHYTILLYNTLSTVYWV